jgi:3-methyladenine DNA glycosylase AlkC
VGTTLRAFQDDPQPVLELLDLLKDDPELLVRRSPNNLNDIGKDNPTALIATSRRWMREPTPERRWLVRHALRSAVKRGDPAALTILGFVPAGAVSARAIDVTPPSSRSVSRSHSPSRSRMRARRPSNYWSIFVSAS